MEREGRGVRSRSFGHSITSGPGGAARTGVSSALQGRDVLVAWAPMVQGRSEGVR